MSAARVVVVFVCCVAVFCVGACAPDLRPLQKEADDVVAEVAAAVVVQQRLVEKVERHKRGLPDVAAADAAGRALRAAVDAAAAEHAAAVRRFEALPGRLRGPFDEAVAARDADAARAALDDAKAAAEAGKRELAEKSNAAIGSIEELRRHIEAEKARANEAVQLLAEVESAEERALHRGGELAFAVGFKDDVVDVDGDGFQRLLGFARRCEALRFELYASGDARTGKLRADAVRAQLEKAKARNRVTKTGAREQEGVAVVVVHPCPDIGTVDD